MAKLSNHWKFKKCKKIKVQCVQIILKIFNRWHCGGLTNFLTFKEKNGLFLCSSRCCLGLICCGSVCRASTCVVYLMVRLVKWSIKSFEKELCEKSHTFWPYVNPTNSTYYEPHIFWLKIHSNITLQSHYTQQETESQSDYYFLSMDREYLACPMSPSFLFCHFCAWLSSDCLSSSAATAKWQVK